MTFIIYTYCSLFGMFLIFKWKLTSIHESFLTFDQQDTLKLYHVVILFSSILWINENFLNYDGFKMNIQLR